MIMTRRRYRMVVSYDGTTFSGWQVQPGHVTIQGELEKVLARVSREIVRVQCSGRTDAGVHARAQVAHFDLENCIPPHRLHGSLTALLDPAIAVTSLTYANAEFHARFDAREKEYRYCIWDGPVIPPFLRLYRFHSRQRLDIEAMQIAAAHLVGRHDFAAFTANPKREIEGTVRHLFELKVSRKGHEVTIIARGEGFLYKMVRSLAGFLMRVGMHRVGPETALEILASRTRTARVPTAQPQGLFLWRVRY